MSNPLDTDAGSELFSSYEAELKLVQADLNQKLDQVAELTGEPRKSAVRLAERAIEEAQELVHFISSRTLHQIEILTVCLARSNAPRKSQHSLLHPLQGKPTLPKLRIRHRRRETKTPLPIQRPETRFW